MDEHNYQPIDCNLYDYIEHFAVLNQPVRIQYKLNNAVIISFKKILDTHTSSDKEEYLILESQSKIRMDQLLSIEHVVFKDS